MPVAKHAVQPLQIVQCRPGAGQHVAAVILKNVLLEFKAFTGGRHELPHARRFGAGHGLGVESALHKGQERELGGHAAQLQFLDDVEQVLARALGHPVEVVRAAGVPDFPIPYLVGVQVWHGKSGADTVPNLRRCIERRDPAARAFQADGRG